MNRLVLVLLVLCDAAFAQLNDPPKVASQRQGQATRSERVGATPHNRPDLFRTYRAGSSGLPPEQQRRLRAIRMEPTTAAVRPVEVNLRALKSRAVKLDVFGRSFTAWRLASQKLDESGRSYSWRGAVTEAQDFLSLHVEDGRIHGTVRTKTMHLELEPIGQRIHAIVEIRPLALREHPPEYPTGAASERRKRDDRPRLPEPKRELFVEAPQGLTPPKCFTDRRVRASQLSTAMRARLAVLKARKSTKSVHLLELNQHALKPDQKALTLNVGRGRSFVAHRTEVIGPETPGGAYTWLGSLVLEPMNMLQLVVNDALCTATLRYGDELFELRPLKGRAHALIRIETAKLPAEHPPDSPTGAQRERR